MNNGRILYIEANTGISGDMLVAALLDLGAPADRLREVLDTLPVDGFETIISRKKRAGIDMCDFEVRLDHEHENNDHDMAYLYGHLKSDPDEAARSDRAAHGPDGSGHSSGLGHVHTQAEGGEPCHETGHLHEDGHVHRTMSDIRDILSKTDMTDRARELALRIFGILARAEAQAHGVPEDEVHFHEVGAVDSIVDIVAAAVCVDALAPERVVVSPLTEGTGTVRTQHGILPVPVPAVANIVAGEGLILRQGFMQGEYVTPTGAAIAAAIRGEWRKSLPESSGDDTFRESEKTKKQWDNRLPEWYTIEKTGIGGGKRAYDPPSMVRAMWLREAENQAPTGANATGTNPVNDDNETGAASGNSCGTRICRLETDIDDSTGEELGRVMELCYEAGAREVHFTPIFMKKNRPAYELVVIADGELVDRMERILFLETTTIGIRRQWMERTVLPRESVTVGTPYGELQAKKVTLPDGSERIYPEYESARELAEKNDVPIRTIVCQLK